MLLFSDGFDSYNIYDIRYKWGFFGCEVPYPTYVPEARIVSGLDTSCNKNWATKGGRALYLGRRQGQLMTTFRPSRTVYAGFAFRSQCNDNVVQRITFATKEMIDRGRGDRMNSVQNSTDTNIQSPYDPAFPVAILDMRIYAYYITYTWTFTGGSVQVGHLDTNMNMLSGDYHYIQVGMTLMGNVSALPEAWCEIRIGNALACRARHQNILTAAPDGTGYFYMNALSLWLNKEMSYYAPAYTTIDDVYILNDEGTVNNGFLGNVKVRRATVSADGTDNDGVPTLQSGDIRRFQAVDEDFIGSNALPYPQPTPEQDPLFIPWELTAKDDYLTLNNRGDRQSFRMHSIDFAGSAPYLHGAILHGLARGSQYGIEGSTMLKGFRRSGLVETESSPIDIPVSTYRVYDSVPRPSPVNNWGIIRSWQDYPLAFDNEEVVPPGQYPQTWSVEAVQNSEWVFELAPCTIDPIMYDPNLVRFNLINDEVCADFLGCLDYTHRYFDCYASDTFNLAVPAPLYERTFKVVDTLYWSPEISLWRMFYKSVNDTIEFAEEIPWVFLFTQSALGIADEIFLEWQDLVAESLAIGDWTSGWWEELFTDAIDITDTAVASFIERLEETFGLEEPYLWDGHEDVEETLEINVTYVWDNHELMEEYLYPDDTLSHGMGLEVEEVIGWSEDHFDGWLVEELRPPLTLTDSILTQHWRYERFFGIVISSWQINPVEQEGQDGNHNGDNPWGW
jgi:hypothetical protein